jgi:hypothetical protein
VSIAIQRVHISVLKTNYFKLPKYVAAHPILDTDVKWAILEGKVGVGMTPEQVIAS